ncbi:hypothetical protein FKK50_27380, partial [Klebsiella pneumoniae]|nr:hypothetical protein [Klebsiella pneumoniae]
MPGAAAADDAASRGKRRSVPVHQIGRYDERGRFVLYHDRAAIEDGALNGKAQVIAWEADPVEFLFLQIQGSGRLLTP